MQRVVDIQKVVPHAGTWIEIAHMQYMVYLTLLDVLGYKEKRIRKFYETMKALKESWADGQAPTDEMLDSFSILQVRDDLMEDAVFQMPQDSDVRTKKELLLEKLEQRVKTMTTTRTLDSKVVTEKFMLWEDVKSAVEEVMSNE